jgi:hypothetical protein
VTPSGAQVHGQSETSVASSGPYVVEARNDGTGFFAPCPSPMNKQELTGFGFSNDGGKTFTDLGGLPNASCNSSKIFGDPSVEAYTVGGSTYFYISSILIPFNVPENALSVTACKVNGSVASATLACSQPIVAAISSHCRAFKGVTSCGFLDKEFLSIDRARGPLYMAGTPHGSGDEPKPRPAIREASSWPLPTGIEASWLPQLTMTGTSIVPYRPKDLVGVSLVSLRDLAVIGRLAARVSGCRRGLLAELTYSRTSARCSAGGS